MGNETSCPSRKNPGETRCSDVISPSEARRLSLDVISPETSYSSVNMSPSMVRRLLERNKSCGLFECKTSPNMVHRLLGCDTH